MRFLNCNYPKTFKIQKGKPEGIKKPKLIIKVENIELYEEMTGVIWLHNTSTRGYYWGIDIENKDVFSDNIVKQINTRLLEWCDIKLNDIEEQLISMYLKIIK